MPTCSLDDTVAVAAERAARAGAKLCVVTGAWSVVLGLLGRSALDGDPGARAEDVMAEGPSTYRPNVSAQEMVRHLEGSSVTTILVTTSAGVLLGAVARDALDGRS